MPRRSTPLSTEQKALVSSVRRISKQRARVNASYIEAVVKARQAGVTFAVIAEAAGMSSQAAQEICRRHGSASDQPSTQANGNKTKDASASITRVSGVQSGVPQGAAAIRQEVGTQDPGE